MARPGVTGSNKKSANPAAPSDLVSTQSLAAGDRPPLVEMALTVFMTKAKPPRQEAIDARHKEENMVFVAHRDKL